ncbi:hypothetical protein [Salidesulfovibrio onnuriiensis]|uniref:hypothetical protein n=1 Tax=Salidesulfovibrio onnuriiensis TaxID=2583823 RepID=UPI0011CB58B7|nr:hypothetical protein [Salidesulfovibrio onnuriiensis]
MENYYVNFSNETDRTWTMAVYQEFPDSVGLDTVAWKKTTVPHSGYSGVTWMNYYNVAIADYRQLKPLGVYTASQALETELGQEWEIIFENGVQQLRHIGALSTDLGDHIVIHNNSGLTANPGVGMSGRGSAYKRDILSNASAQFKVTPTYYAALFRDVELGEVISSNIEVGPIQLQFSQGTNVANVTAIRTGDSIELACVYART